MDSDRSTSAGILLNRVLIDAFERKFPGIRAFGLVDTSVEVVMVDLNARRFSPTTASMLLKPPGARMFVELASTANENSPNQPERMSRNLVAGEGFEPSTFGL